jgi:hypothetical protein
LANFKFIGAYPGEPGGYVSVTGTSQQWQLGDTVQAIDFGTTATQSTSINPPYDCGAGIFQYGVGYSVSAPQSRGQLVQLIGNSVKLMGSGSSLVNLPLGIAAGPISASNVYGWVQVRGMLDYGRLDQNADVTAGTSAFIGSAADGCIASTQTATGNALLGVHFPVSIGGASSNSATLFLNFPKVMMGSAL